MYVNDLGLSGCIDRNRNRSNLVRTRKKELVWSDQKLVRGSASFLPRCGFEDSCDMLYGPGSGEIL